MTQKERYVRALNSFAERLKQDPNVIALLLYGSLAYGTVWERSDIDVELIVRDGTSYATQWVYLLEEDGVDIELIVISELAEFKGNLQKKRDGFDFGKYGTGNLIFSKDESLYELFEDARKIGDNDAPKAFAAKIGLLLNWMYKAEKHVTVINNPLYAQRFLQLSASTVAEMELIRHKENPNREAILRAQQLNPDLMQKTYVISSTTAMTKEDILNTLKYLDDYLMQHMDWWSKHIIRFLSDGEVKPCTQIWQHCGGAPLEYLAEKGVIIRVTEPVKLFKKSKLTLDEAAYFYIKEEN